MKGILIDVFTGDIYSNGSSLAIGNVDEQIAEVLLKSFRGEWKEYPNIGLEVYNMIGGKPDVMWGGIAKKQLRICGLSVRKIIIKDNTITIE